MNKEIIKKLIYSSSFEDTILGWEHLLTLSEEDIISILPVRAYQRTSRMHVKKVEVLLLTTRFVMFEGNVWWARRTSGDEIWIQQEGWVIRKLKS